MHVNLFNWPPAALVVELNTVQKCVSFTFCYIFSIIIVTNNKESIL